MAAVIESVPIVVLDNDGTSLIANIHGDLTVTLVVARLTPIFQYQEQSNVTLSMAQLEHIVCLVRAAQGKSGCL